MQLRLADGEAQAVGALLRIYRIASSTAAAIAARVRRAATALTGA